jgi:hypothetical protein
MKFKSLLGYTAVWSIRCWSTFTWLHGSTSQKTLAFVHDWIPFQFCTRPRSTNNYLLFIFDRMKLNWVRLVSNQAIWRDVVHCCSQPLLHFSACIIVLRVARCHAGWQKEWLESHAWATAAVVLQKLRQANRLSASLPHTHSLSLLHYLPLRLWLPSFAPSLQNRDICNVEGNFRATRDTCWVTLANFTYARSSSMLITYLFL